MTRYIVESWIEPTVALDAAASSVRLLPVRARFETPDRARAEAHAAAAPGRVLTVVEEPDA